MEILQARTKTRDSHILYECQLKHGIGIEGPELEVHQLNIFSEHATTKLSLSSIRKSTPRSHSKKLSKSNTMSLGFQLKYLITIGNGILIEKCFVSGYKRYNNIYALF